MLFIIPWGRHWIIGTTDTDWTMDKAHPAATSADIDYVLEHANAVLKSPLTREDVEGVYAGPAPAAVGESESTSKLSREHVVGHPVPGLVVVAGGKYTTYRVMAKDAVDVAVEGLDGRVPRLDHRERADGRRRGLPRDVEPAARSRGPRRDPRRPRRAPAQPLRVGDRRGLALIAQDPSLGEVLPHADDYLKAEVVYAVTHEGARHLDDVLARRTRISIETYDRGTKSAELVADLMAGPLGWSEEERATEVKTYLGTGRRGARLPGAAGRRLPDAVRLQAPEIVPV